MTKTPAPITDSEFLKRQAAQCAKRGDFRAKKRLEKIARKLAEAEKAGAVK